MIGESNDNSGCYRMNRVIPYHLDAFNDKMSMSVYCNCGRIVVLDRSEMKLRHSLGKELECMSCRNIRISHEIDALNAHFNGVDEIDDSLF